MSSKTREKNKRWTDICSVLQLRQRSSEAVLNFGHLSVSVQQLLLESRDVDKQRHFLQNGAEALERGPDLFGVVQHHLQHQTRV